MIITREKMNGFNIYVAVYKNQVGVGTTRDYAIKQLLNKIK